MTRFAPVVRLVASQVAEIRRLRSLVQRLTRTATIAQAVNERLLVTNRALSLRLEQRERDLDLVALMIPAERREQLRSVFEDVGDIRSLDERKR